MLVFAHRGDSGSEPENTLRAIQAALAANVDGIEIDVHEADDQLFVIHDRWLQTTTSGSGLVSQQSFEYLRSLNAGLGEKIPTLDEVLLLTANKCLLNIELKGLVNSSLLFACLDKAISASTISIDNILLSSFNHHCLVNIYQQRPEFSLGALTASTPLAYAKFAEQLNANSVHIALDFVCQKFVDDAHERGLKVLVYTVDEFDDIEWMKVLGVDGIFTNYPARAKRFLEKISCRKL